MLARMPKQFIAAYKASLMHSPGYTWLQAGEKGGAAQKRV